MTEKTVILPFLNDLRYGHQFRGPDIPYFFVGDEGFALNRNILRPFGGSNLSVKKRVYNYHLRRA